MVLESNTLDFLFLNDGEKGVPGEKGDDGKTLYTWIKYSQYSGMGRAAGREGG